MLLIRHTTSSRSSISSTIPPASKKSSMDKTSLLEVISEERRRASFPDKKVTLTATSLTPNCPVRSLSFYKAQSCAEVVQLGVDKLVKPNVENGQKNELERHYVKNVKKVEYRRSSKLDFSSYKEIPNINIIPTSSTYIDVSASSQDTVEETVDIFSRPKKLKRNNSVNLKIQEQQLLQKRRRASNNHLPALAFQAAALPSQLSASPAPMRRHSFITRKLSKILKNIEHSNNLPDKPPQTDCPLPLNNHKLNLPVIKIDISNENTSKTTTPTLSLPTLLQKNHF